MLLEQVGHRERGERRHQRLPLAHHVAAIDDGADDAGVGGRAADAVFFERLDQRRFGEARRRLGLVAHRLERGAVRRVARASGGSGVSRSSSAASGSSEPSTYARRKPAKSVRNPLARKVALRTASSTAVDVFLRILHLRRHGALPDQVVERQLVVFEAGLVGRAEHAARRTDRLVRFLRVGDLVGIAARLVRQVLLAVEPLHQVAGRGDRLVRQRHRIGTHVGDEAALVQALRHLHRLLGGVAQLAVGFLLQRRRGERRVWPERSRRLLDADHLPARLAKSADECLRRRLVEQHHVGALGELAGLLVEVLAGGEALAVERHHPGFELLRCRAPAWPRGPSSCRCGTRAARVRGRRSGASPPTARARPTGRRPPSSRAAATACSRPAGRGSVAFPGRAPGSGRRRACVRALPGSPRG